MPGSFQASGIGGVPNTPGLPAVRNFTDNVTSPVFEYPYAIAGVTRNSTGGLLANCQVILFRTADNSVAGIAVSDASGNYRIGASPSVLHYAIARLDGVPDVMGSTDNNLVGS